MYAMYAPETVRVTFTCSHCGSVNELTAAHVHEATVIHCSRCSAAIAPLAVLNRKSVAPAVSQLVNAWFPSAP